VLIVLDISHRCIMSVFSRGLYAQAVFAPGFVHNSGVEVNINELP
jgi:hypothetical protein